VNASIHAKQTKEYRHANHETSNIERGDKVGGLMLVEIISQVDTKESEIIQMRYGIA